MEVRVKTELRDFSSTEDGYADAGRKVKIEPVNSTCSATEQPPQHRHVMMTHCQPHDRPQCRCRIDLSSPDSLERDFYAWLKGSEPASGSVPCLFASSSVFHSSQPTEQGGSVDCSFLSLEPLGDLKSQQHSRWDVFNSASSASSDCLSSHSSVSPGNCSSAHSSCSKSSSSASSSTSSIDPFISSVMPLSHSHLHQHNSPNHQQQTLHPFFQQHHQQYKLMITTCADQQHQPQKHHPLAMPSSSSNAAAKSVPIPGTRIRRKRNVDKASGRGTNLYGRSYCPGRPLSMEERAQIIHLFHGGMKVNAISKQLCISHGCVSKIITRFRETGNLMPSSHSECRRRKRQQQQQQQQQQGQLINGPNIG
uniref:Paired domain-containing protein n=1 Tax=Globodera rostochiensis TaxID=31243 RepID=A0A914HH57_GLORO